MLGQFEEKGKIYTPVISKEPVDVFILTTTQRIKGKVHIRHGERLKDQLDHDERYIAVTEAEILDNEGKLLFTANFLAINHTNIIWISPLSDLQPAEEVGHE